MAPVIVPAAHDEVLFLPDDLAADGKPRGLEVRQAALTKHDVYIADEMFLTGTAAEVIPVVKVDSRVIGGGQPGPITRDLMERFRKLTVG